MEMISSFNHSKDVGEHRQCSQQRNRVLPTLHRQIEKKRRTETVFATEIITELSPDNYVYSGQMHFDGIDLEMMSLFGVKEMDEA